MLLKAFLVEDKDYIDALVQERRNSIANALELRLSRTNPSICCKFNTMATDALVTWAWASRAIVLTSLSWNILFSAEEG